MQSQDKFSLLRTILRALGLSPDAVDDIIDRISDWLSAKDEKPAEQIDYPYCIRDDFLTAAEHSFYLVLKSAVAEWALICPKVALGDLFYAKSSDPSKYRTYSNKIDRKHIDFLLCDPRTVRPLMGIELDDKSHTRSDRQERDEFVHKVFMAAGLPLIRVPVRHSYSSIELSALLRQHVGQNSAAVPSAQIVSDKDVSSPKCPKCGSQMLLRIAKSGANQGEQFWGCPNFPRCRGTMKHEK